MAKNNAITDRQGFKWLKNYIRKNYGKKCPDYEPECVLCQAWKFFEELKELHETTKAQKHL